MSFFGTLYAFGGRGPFVERFSCSMYATYYWEKCGQKLKESRFGHRSIAYIDSIYHIGGSYNETTKGVPIEKWTFMNNGKFNITTSIVQFDDYFEYPEVFHFENGFFC